jgi:replicative DNA helicase
VDVNLESEMCVLGAILIDAPHALPVVIDIISASDFYTVPHQQIYTAMLKMFSENSAVDFVTLSEKLQIDDAKTYLLRLADMIPSIANTKAYAEIVAKNAKVRKFQKVILEIQSETISAENIDEVIEKLQADTYNFTVKAARRGLRATKDIAMDWYTNLFKSQAQIRVDTGYTDLDRILKGMWGGNLILLAARPAVGKSAFALNIGKHVAKQGKTVNVFSCEMEENELMERMVADESGVCMDDLIDSESLKDNQEKIALIAKGVDTVYKLPLNISDNSSITVSQIRAQCRMTKNLGLIIVDYLQLLQSSKKSENRNQEVGAISRELKNLANDLKVPVLALSQLNREAGKGTAQPTMINLRDSGELEQNANKIMFIWDVDAERHIVAVSVAKNRRGSLGQAQFIFDGSHMTHRPLLISDYVKLKGDKKIDYDNEFSSKTKKGSKEYY